MEQTITTEDTIELKDDHLDRGRYARSLYRIIGEYKVVYKWTQQKGGKTIREIEYSKPMTNTDNEAFIMAVSAPWGFGKTFFMELFEKILARNENTIVKGINYFPDHLKINPDNIIRYDAWKHDFWDNALEPLYDTLLHSNFNKVTKKNDEEQEVTDLLLKPLTGIVKMTMKGVLGYAMMHPFLAALPEAFKGEVLDTPGKLFDFLKNTYKDYDPAKDSFPEYATFRDAIDELRNNLDFAVNGDDKTKGKDKLVIIIDELDRCKPTFAVQTLEIVKHLFNVPNVVFIFSLDITQLRHCVQRVYGDEFDSVGYLERFFDYTTLLPQGDMENLFTHTLKNDFNVTADDNQADIYYKICSKFHLSVREVRAVCSAFHYLEKFELQEYPPVAKQMYFYLLVLKYKMPVEVIDAISDTKKGTETREKLMTDYAPVFMSDDCDITPFVEVFKANPIISSPSVFKHVPSHNSKPISFSSSFTLNGGSFSYVLYAPDQKIFDKIVNYRLLEYLFRKVELYDTAL